MAKYTIVMSLVPWLILAAAMAAVLLADRLARRRLPAAALSAVWLGAIPVGIALGFGVWLHLAYAGHWFGLVGGKISALGPHSRRPMLEYTAGYLLELSLSADNIMLLVLLIRSFNVPLASQGFVLFWAILGSMILRTVLILTGLALLLKIPALLYAMGLFVLAAGIAMFFETDGEERLGQWLIRLLSRRLPVQDAYEGRRLIVRRAGRRYATPLLIVLVLLAVMDMVFALDSIPAIFGITRDPLIVVSSNLFAVLALQSLFFILAPLVDRLRYLQTGLAVILLFIALKILLAPLARLVGYRGHPHIGTGGALAFISAVLAAAILASLLNPKRANS